MTATRNITSGDAPGSLIEARRRTVTAVNWDRTSAAEAVAAEALLAHVCQDVAELQRKTRYILEVFTEDTGSSETTVPRYGQLFLEAIMALRP